MKRYRVFGHTTVTCSMIVEAENEQKAIEKANDSFGGIASYVGMGGTDKLIGVYSSENDRSIAADEDVEFDDCMEIRSSKPIR